MITVLLYRFRRNPLLEGLSIIVLCGIVEYTTSLVMENTLGMRWWDYTGYFLNLNGRICGEGLAVFALGGMAAVYLLVPMLDAAVTKMKPKDRVTLLYRKFLGRAPTSAERKTVDDAKLAPRDLAWCLLNTREFLYRC